MIVAAADQVIMMCELVSCKIKASIALLQETWDFINTVIYWHGLAEGSHKAVTYPMHSSFSH